MANRDLLREAIADAKAVKEVAIANAKAALEEAFTPQLQSMLSEKISQLDEEEITEDDLAEVDKERQEEANKKILLVLNSLTNSLELRYCFSVIDSLRLFTFRYSFNSSKALSTGAFLSSESLSPNSFNCFSV